MRTALIAGATGAIGHQLLKHLTESNLYSEIHVIGRRKALIVSDKIQTHIVPNDHLENFTLPQRIDDAFCTIGTTIKIAGSIENFQKIDRDYVFNIGKIAAQSHAKTFSVVSSINANKHASHYYSQTKGQIEQELKNLHFPSLRIFRPSLLYGARRDFRVKEALGYALLWIIKPILVGHLRKYRAIHINQVAKAMYLCALEEHPNIILLESNAIQSYY